MGTRRYESIRSFQEQSPVSCLFFLNHSYLAIKLLLERFSFWRGHMDQATIAYYEAAHMELLLEGARSGSLGKTELSQAP